MSCECVFLNGLRSYPVDFGQVVAVAMMRDSAEASDLPSTSASLHGLRGPQIFERLMQDADVWPDV